MKLPPTNQNINFPQKYFIFILLQFLWPKSQTVRPTFRQHFFLYKVRKALLKTVSMSHVCVRVQISYVEYNIAVGGCRIMYDKGRKCARTTKAYMLLITISCFSLINKLEGFSFGCFCTPCQPAHCLVLLYS